MRRIRGQRSSVSLDSANGYSSTGTDEALAAAALDALQTIFRMTVDSFYSAGADSAGESTYSDALYPRDFEFFNDLP